MAETTQCENCGAALTADDQFCGECGAPRRLPDNGHGARLDTSAPSHSSRLVRWRVAVVVLVNLGILACLAGVLGFLLFGSIGGEELTAQENWLIASVCCLLPIGGLGALLLAVGATLWYTRRAHKGTRAEGDG